MCTVGDIRFHLSNDLSETVFSPPCQHISFDRKGPPLKIACREQIRKTSIYENRTVKFRISDFYIYMDRFRIYINKVDYNSKSIFPNAKNGL